MIQQHCYNHVRWVWCLLKGETSLYWLANHSCRLQQVCQFLALHKGFFRCKKFLGTWTHLSYTAKSYWGLNACLTNDDRVRWNLMRHCMHVFFDWKWIDKSPNKCSPTSVITSFSSIKSEPHLMQLVFELVQIACHKILQAKILSL